MQAHVASGAVQRVLPNYSGRVIDIHLLYHSRKHVSKTLQTMIDFLRQAFRG
jgi:DNA-binding transcriptional LysR family regulator